MPAQASRPASLAQEKGRLRTTRRECVVPVGASRATVGAPRGEAVRSAGHRVSNPSEAGVRILTFDSQRFRAPEPHLGIAGLPGGVERRAADLE